MKQKRVEFTVTGRGVFPFDMLRYDACHPKLESEVWVFGEGATGERRAVTLVSLSPTAPTVARWNSFGWNVSDVQNKVW